MSHSKRFVDTNQVSLFDYFQIPEKPISKRVQEFIRASRIVHGDRYDYSLVDDTTWPIVRIICPVHGVIQQLFTNHKNGHGCRQCGHAIACRKHKVTPERFEKRVRDLYGDDYDISEVNYVNNRTKVKIICKKHGFFMINPDKLFMGGGCQQCARERTTASRGLSQKEFLEKCKAIHGDRYDYSKIVYIRNKSKVEIICRGHGSFWMTPNNHINGGHNGCPVCANIERANFRRHTTKQFVQAAKQVHGDKYDYSKVDYYRAQSNVVVVCPEHGEFLVTPDNHIRGKTGCLTCLASSGEKSVAVILDEMGISYQRQKRFKDCRDKRELPFDFYFEINGKPFLIEFDGAQHFVPWALSGQSKRQITKEHTLSEVQRRDTIKNKFALEAGIPLIRISYKVKDRRAYLVERLKGYEVSFKDWSE